MNIYVRKFEVMLITRIIKIGGGVCQFNFVFLCGLLLLLSRMRLVYNFICLSDFHISIGYVHTFLFSLMGFYHLLMLFLYWIFLAIKFVGNGH